MMSLDEMSEVIRQGWLPIAKATYVEWMHQFVPSASADEIEYAWSTTPAEYHNFWIATAKAAIQSYKVAKV